MIVASLVLILIAVVLLVLGLSSGSSPILVSSIAASLLAAVALVVGARQSAAARDAADAADADYRLRDANVAAGPSGASADAVATAAAGTRAEQRTGRRASGTDSAVALAEPTTGDDPAAAHGSRDPDPYPPDSDESGAPQGADVRRSGWPERETRVTDSAERESGWPERDPPVADAAERASRSAEQRSFVVESAPQDWRVSEPPESDDVLPGRRRDAATAVAAEPGAAGGPSASEPNSRTAHEPAGGSAGAETPYRDVEDPADEPAVQRVSAHDAAQVARLGTEVLVVDGRPRYHLAGCRHLAGRPVEALPVSEAVELGFSPCALCRPIDQLLVAARRG